MTGRLKMWLAPASQLTDWMGLSRVISVTRNGLRHHQKFHSETYYITSEAINAYRLSKLIRGPRRTGLTQKRLTIDKKTIIFTT